MRKRTVIAEKYPEYEELLSRLKVAEARLLLRKKLSNHNWLASNSPLEHESIEEELVMISERHRASLTNFKFQIRATYLCPEPVFRFDSEGLAHRNRLPGVPLAEQQVTTPHFNRFNEQGVMIAYKTPALLDPKQSAILATDLNLALAHFCDVGNVRTADGQFPEVIESEPPLFPHEDRDPHAGIEFP